MQKQSNYKAPKDRVTFAHQVAELVLGVQYFANFSDSDKLKTIDLLAPLAISFFQKKDLAANYLNAFELRNELVLFVHQNLMRFSNYQTQGDTRTDTGKKIDNTVRDVRSVLSQYLKLRANKINPKPENTKKSSFNHDEKLVLGMPESVAPMAIVFFAMLLFYVAWVYLKKGKTK